MPLLAEKSLEKRSDRLLKALLMSAVFIAGLIVSLVIYGTLNRIPTTNVEFTRVDRDTVFYIGKGHGKERLGGQLSVWVTGVVIDSTAVLSLEYPYPDAVFKQISLAAGEINTIMTGDFYDQRAKVSYRHNHVRTGQLRLQTVFSSPPEDWPLKLTTNGWVRVRKNPG